MILQLKNFINNLSIIIILAYTFHLTLSSTNYYDLLGVSKQATDREIRKAFKKLALTKHPDKNRDDPDAEEKFIIINRAYEALKDPDTRKKYDKYGEEGLKDDFNGGRHYESWNFYQEEFGLYDDDEEIVTLNRGDFHQSVDSSESIWFVNFYSPHCHHCHDLAPTWRRLGQEMEGVIRIGAVNCGDEWHLCRQENVYSYPTLYIYPSKAQYHGSRDLDSLLKFVMQYVRSSVKHLNTENFDQTIESGVSDPWLISFCTEDQDCLSKRSVVKLSAMFNGLVNVGSINCDKQASLCSKLGHTQQSVFYKDRSLTKETSVLLPALVVKDIAKDIFNMLPDFNILSEEQLMDIQHKTQSKESKAWLIHFVDTDTHDVQLKRLPALLKQKVNIGRVDCRLSSSQCQNLFIKSPSFVVFKSGSGHEIYYGKISPYDVASFTKDSITNPLETLTFSHFPEVTSGTVPWVIDFFAPWCPPCMNFLPEFRKAARRTDLAVRFGTVDCSMLTTICNQYNIHSYPTTIFYNQSTPHQFHGEHDANDVLEFIEDVLQPSVISLDPESYNSKVFERAKTVVVAVDFYLMSCHPCRQLAPEWRRLAKMHRNSATIRIADINCAMYSQFCKEQGVHSYPTIRLYTAGGKKQFEQFRGWNRDAGSLNTWITDYLPSSVVLLTTNKFNNKVLYSREPWIVYYYANWCGHCQMMKPVYSRVADRLYKQVNAGKVDCEEDQWLCEQASIYQYPTIKFYPGMPNQDHYSSHSIDGEDEHSIVHQLQQLLKQYKTKKIPRDEL